MMLQVAGLQEACNISGFVSSAKVIVENCWPAGNGRLQSGITSQSVIRSTSTGNLQLSARRVLIGYRGQHWSCHARVE